MLNVFDVLTLVYPQCNVSVPKVMEPHPSDLRPPQCRQQMSLSLGISIKFIISQVHHFLGNLPDVRVVLKRAWGKIGRSSPCVWYRNPPKPHSWYRVFPHGFLNALCGLLSLQAKAPFMRPIRKKGFSLHEPRNTKCQKHNSLEDKRPDCRYQLITESYRQDAKR